MPEPQTVAELMEQVHSRRAELEALVQRFDLEQREVAGSSGWSLKDHLAHVAAWERSLLALLRGQDRGVAVGLEPGEKASLDTDGINDRIFVQHYDRPFEDVRQFFDSTHAEVLATLSGLSDEDLQRAYSHYQPHDPPHNPQPVVGWITGNTSEHYEEHIGWLQALAAELMAG